MLPQGLVETYHGVNVDIRYCIEVDIARSGFFSSSIHAEEEFHVETPATMDQISDDAVDFEINPNQLRNVKSSSMDKIPRTPPMAFTARHATPPTPPLHRLFCDWAAKHDQLLFARPLHRAHRCGGVRGRNSIH